MKSHRGCCAVVIATWLMVGLVGCGSSSTPTCEAALTHFYDASCTLTSGGQSITLSDAITGCNDEQPTYKSCGCLDQYNAALKCFNSVGASQCSNCDSQLAAMNTCSSGCSSCVQAGNTCSTTSQCCKGMCISEDYVCHDPCTLNSDCNSNCCVSVTGGGYVCASASHCS